MPYGLVPSIIVSRENANIEEKLDMYKSDLPSPHTLNIEYDRWLSWTHTQVPPCKGSVKHLYFEVVSVLNKEV